VSRVTGPLSRTPLRIRLVAAVLALVTAALVVISVASAVMLRSHLVDRVDDGLVEAALLRSQPAGLPSESRASALPSDYVLSWQTPEGVGVTIHDRAYSVDDLPPLPSDLAEATLLVGGGPYTVEASGGPRWRLLVTMLPDGSVLTIAQDMSDVDAALGRLIWTEVVVGAAVLALLAAVGAALIRRSLRLLAEIGQTAGAIAAGDLTRRVPDPEPAAEAPRTELGRLSRALNSMLAQIEAAFAARAASENTARDAAAAAQASESRARRSEERMRQFIGDASHELRTPLTSIRGFAELYRQGAAGSPEQASALIRRIEDEASRMSLLVQDLLLLARLDQERPLDQAPVELPVVVSDAVEAARAVEPDRRIELELRADGVPMVVHGDEARLRQVADNLLRNALTHTPPGTGITVRLCAEPGVAVLEVADRGPGLAPEQAERVFERFYRVDSARSRRPPTTGDRPVGPGGGGTGLGLAIVAALVAAHRGAVEVDSVPGRGATFRVRLPLAPEEDMGRRSADCQDEPRRIEE
jgi:two-component system OmpR family sensor kinase